MGFNFSSVFSNSFALPLLGTLLSSFGLELKRRDDNTSGADDFFGSVLVVVAPVAAQAVAGGKVNESAVDTTALALYQGARAYLEDRGLDPETGRRRGEQGEGFNLPRTLLGGSDARQWQPGPNDEPLGFGTYRTPSREEMERANSEAFLKNQEPPYPAVWPAARGERVYDQRGERVGGIGAPPPPQRTTAADGGPGSRVIEEGGVPDATDDLTRDDTTQS